MVLFSFYVEVFVENACVCIRLIGLYVCSCSVHLTCAPSVFQRLMDLVLCGLTYETCLVYLDDIIVFSRDFDSHIERLRQVFDRLRMANLKLHEEVFSVPA